VDIAHNRCLALLDEVSRTVAPSPHHLAFCLIALDIDAFVVEPVALLELDLLLTPTQVFDENLRAHDAAWP
jgi:hypothetical protein